MNGTRSQPPSWLELHVSSSAGLFQILLLHFGHPQINFGYGVGMPHANILINVCKFYI